MIVNFNFPRRKQVDMICYFYLLIFLCFQLSPTTAFKGWIDPDTAIEDMTRASYTDGYTYDLIMSDEFNRPGRTFKDGDDPMWTGMNECPSFQGIYENSFPLPTKKVPSKFTDCFELILVFDVMYIDSFWTYPSPYLHSVFIFMRYAHNVIEICYHISIVRGMNLCYHYICSEHCLH